MELEISAYRSFAGERLAATGSRIHSEVASEKLPKGNIYCKKLPIPLKITFR
jgi:hypothetical protein